MKIILADDEDLVRFGVRDMLAECSVPATVVAEARNGTELVELCGRHRPDVAIVDIRMPKLGGLEAIERIRAHSPETDWIILTSYSEFEYARRAISVGAADYLLKPVEAEELERALRSAQERKRARLEAENTAFENLFSGLLSGALREIPADGGRVKRVTAFLFVVDCPAAGATDSPGIERIDAVKLRADICESIRTAIGEVLTPSLRAAVTIHKRGTIVCAIGWEAAPEGSHLAKEAPAALERFQRRLAPICDRYLGEGCRIAVIRSPESATPAAAVERVAELTDLAARAAIEGRGGSIDIDELRSLAAERAADPARRDSPVERALTYLNENFAEAVSVEEIARSLGITPNYLSALFHRETGTTFKSHLTRLRMEKARDLLTACGMSVFQVSRSVGYGSARHFARTFKDYFGRYPSEMRRGAGVRDAGVREVNLPPGDGTAV